MALTRVLTQKCIASIVERVGLDVLLDELIGRLATAFATYDRRSVQTIVRGGFRYASPEFGLIEWMPAMESGRRVSIKTVGYHPANPVAHGAPSVLATTSLHNTADGRLLALCESTFLTALRTGAASAVVTDALAIPDASTLGVIGCGAQAVTQIHAISRVRPIARVVAFDIDRRIAGTLARRLGRAGLATSVDLVDAAAPVVTGVDILCTATSVSPGAPPVVPDVAHRPWLHINAVGADHPGKRELAAGLVARAVVVPDDLEQCAAEGEVQHVAPDRIGPELADLVRHRGRYEHLRAQLTVFDSTGWALEDLVAAELVLDHAERLDEGFALELQPSPGDPYDPYEFLFT
jgi:ornithine cyclodeaminase/alanine dehydrogenase-like protein (mu-crystallin family)